MIDTKLHWLAAERLKRQDSAYIRELLFQAGLPINFTTRFRMST